MKPPHSSPDLPPPCTRGRLSSRSHASRHLRLQHAKFHPFFDRLPEDALALIVQRLALNPASDPAACPLLSLACVSPEARLVVARTVGTRLALSVYENSDWFWSWLTISASHIQHLALHNRSYRITGSVRYIWPTWPRRPIVQLEAYPALRAIRETGAALQDLDISGLQSFRRTGLAALEYLLLSVRDTLKALKLDLGHFRIANHVQNARLFNLRKLTILNIDGKSEAQLLLILRSLEEHYGEGSGLTELAFDTCDCIPSIFRKQREAMLRLLPKLEKLHVDYDDEFQSFMPFACQALDNLCAAVTMPSLRRICLSGSGIPVTQRLISEIRGKCPQIDDLRLMDCDVASKTRSGDFTETVLCREALVSAGKALTRYYPRWITFKLEQLDTIALHCHRLTHLRIFTAPGVEDALDMLGKSLADTLIELELYPKIHEQKEDITDAIVSLIQNLKKLERLSLVTLELSRNQLKTVLRHCGEQLKSLTFSPCSDVDGDATAECIEDILLTAAQQNPNLQQLQCILSNDALLRVKTKSVGERLKCAVRVLETRAPRLESSSIVTLVNQMVGESDGSK